MLAFRVRTQVLRHWRSWLGWVAFVGLSGGVIIAALAGARRTETVHDRFVEDTAAFDVLFTNGGTTPTNLNNQFDFDEIRRLPSVAHAANLRYYFPAGETGDGRRVTLGDITPLAPTDPTFGRDFNRLRAVDGRLPTASNEIAVSPVTAQTFDLSPGDSMSLQLAAMPPMGLPGEPEVAMERFEIVGIVAIEGGFPPLTGGLPPPLLLAPSYGDKHPESAQVFAVELVDGAAGTASFQEELQRLAGDEQIITSTQAELGRPVQRGLDIQATALRGFAAVVGLVAAVLAFQALRRRTALDSRDDGVWGALGSTTGELARGRASVGLVLALPTALVAVAGAIILSPLFPTGSARDLEVDPGFDIDTSLVLLGGLAVAAAVVAAHGMSAVAQWTVGRRLPTGARRTRGASATGATAPMLAAASLSTRRQNSMPFRSTVVSVAISIATVATFAVFSDSLQRLFAEPRLYGWSWDIQVGDSFAAPLDDLAASLRADPDAGSVALATTGRVNIDGVDIDAIGIEAGTGVEPTVVEGAAPRTADEILLGSRTLDNLGLSIGDRVEVDLGAATAELTISGRGVFAEFAGAARLGEGASLTLEGFRRLAPDAETDVVLVRAPQTEAGRKVIERLTDERPADIYLPAKPADVADLERVGGLPSLIAALLGLAGLFVLGHSLVTTTRRSRRELATLAAIGFVRRQTATVVWWQSIAVTVGALLIGLPTGVLAGRLLWDVFADRVGVPNEPVVPIGLLVAIVVISMLGASIAALSPAWIATRLPAARSLSSD